MAPMSPPLPRRWSITPSDLNWAVLGIGLIIAAMWVRHGGLGLFDSPLNALVAVGQLTALFGTYLALVGIVLMSRAPVSARYNVRGMGVALSVNTST